MKVYLVFEECVPEEEIIYYLVRVFSTDKLAQKFAAQASKYHVEEWDVLDGREGK